MTIGPIDVTNAARRFRRSFRGYKASDVEQFLAALSGELEALLAHKGGLEEKIEALQQRLDTYYEMEELLKNAVVTAESAAQDKRENAKKEAELIVAEAGQKRSRLLDEAHEEMRKVREDIERLKAERSRFAAQMRSTLQAELSLLDSGHVVVEEKSALGTEVDEPAASSG
jgi:cell division initiation protein